MVPHDPPSSAERPEGTVVGGYRLLSVLGEGGMGVVYEALQDSPRREVALKLVRPGPGFAEHRRRFEFEAEVLGWLNHPAIARIYGAGVADLGGRPQPYFAMELVRGEALDAYVARVRPDLRARLELFVAICEGVEHAHRKGVLHRDLKPANLLVQEDGRPKVLDFGVARVLDVEDEATALRTATGELVGTLAYMSPEQVRGDAARVDVRSDVHALGLVLHETIAGRRAFELSGVPLPEAMRRVLEDDPPHLAQVAPGTPSDVATLVRKATDKDPDRRYASVRELAEDVRRFLRDEPIQARPASAAYHVSRFVRRHRVLVGGLAAVFAVLLAGVGVSSSLYLREQVAAAESRSAQGDAEVRLRRVLETNRTFDALLTAPFPDQDGRDVLMVDVLQQAAHEARGAFPDDPVQRSWLLWSLGQTFLSLRLPGEAVELLQEAREAVELHHAEGPFEELDRIARASLLDHLGHGLTDLRRFDEAEEALQQALRDLEGLDQPTAWRTRSDVEFTFAQLRSRTGEADDAASFEAHMLRAEEALAAAGGGSPRERASLLSARVDEYVRLGRPEEALVVGERALALLEDAGLEESAGSALLHNSLGSVLYQLGRPEPAVEHLRRSIELSTRAYGPDHETLAVQHGNLGTLLRSFGRTEEAREAYETARAILERLGLDPHLALARTLSNLGTLDIAGGERRQGVDLLLRAEAMLDELEGGHLDLDRAWISTYLVRGLMELGELDEALLRSDQALAIKERVAGPRHPMLIGDLTNRGDLLLARGEAAEALTVFERGLAIVEAVQGPGTHDAFLFRRQRCAALGEMGRWEDALAALEPSRHLAPVSFPAGHWAVDDLAVDVAWCEVHLGRDGALQRMAQAVDAMASKLSPGHARLGQQRSRLEGLQR